MVEWLNKMSIIKFQKILRIRTVLKTLSQLSWSISQMEKRYPLDALNDKEIDDLLNTYIEYAGQLKKLNKELQAELNEN